MKKRAICLLCTLGVGMLSCGFGSAKKVDSFNEFQVTYSGGERYTDYVEKDVTNRDGVVNLNRDSGSAWVTANMKDEEGNYYGGVTLQRGTRKTFASNGRKGQNYHLGIRKTNNTGGGTVKINGSWSPDYQ